MKVVFFGTPNFAIPTLEALIQDSEIEVLAVVTQPDKPKGRGKKLIPSPVKEMATSNNIPVLQPKRVKKDQATLQQLREMEADAFVVTAYGQILSAEILEMPRLGCINVHGSILPQYRGAAPIQWSLYNGEAEVGVTTMLMDTGMDTGAMLLTASTPVSLLDNAETVGERLANIGGELLVTTLWQWDQGNIEATPQNEAEATYAPLIGKQDYELDWSKSAIALHNQIRGFYPSCTTSLRGEPLKILATIPLGEPYWSELPPDYKSLQEKWDNLTLQTGEAGEIVAVIKKWGAVVQTGEGFLLLSQVQRSGKRPQSGWDFVNGMRLTVGEKLSFG
ncbi:methionyl-tRNA formyltransferase [Euhalothece natronophila Z-M001]|uniref:Methionyl-tRNA formyltransferase n=1 Tax=Euhalothece natronophila Z-M001 TaxID=522448 RepID=A0A5B8NMN9_9CHRO|nr:methionyl-tRNA formyltransferase [Euhalothece natronophila]QDZ40187.1 methionyl-tRNA formyltransferase [Euhalothece natronophila Z-M001]